MRHFFLCTLFLLCLVDAEAKDSTYLAAVKIEGKWGYISPKGEIVIQAIFDSVLSFSEGLAAVSIKNKDTSLPDKWGFIDINGKWVIQPQFTSASSFSEGLAVAGINGQKSPVGLDEIINEEIGYINKSGNWMILPKKNTLFYPFHGGIAVYVLQGKNFTYGYINKKGIVVLDASYKDALPFQDNRGIINWDRNTYAIVDKNGKRIFRTNAKISSFSENNALVYTDVGILLIDTLGNVVRTIEDVWWMDNFHEGLSAAYSIKSSFQGGYIDKEGNWVIKPSYSWCSGFSNGLALVQMVNQSGEFEYYYIDTHGKIVISGKDLNGELFKDFNVNMAAYKTHSKWYFVNKAGKTIGKGYENALDFVNCEKNNAE